MAYSLKPVATPADWQAMHDIRRATLFVPGRHGDEFVYDENHPADRDPRACPYLFLLDGRAIGVCRLDRLENGRGVMRLVAIVEAEQRRGHGRAMSALFDAEARKSGVSSLCVNAYPTAVGFYERTGWRQEVWDPSELFGLAEHAVQMTKPL